MRPEYNESNNIRSQSYVEFADYIIKIAESDSNLIPLEELLVKRPGDIGQYNDIMDLYGYIISFLKTNKGLKSFIALTTNHLVFTKNHSQNFKIKNFSINLAQYSAKFPGSENYSVLSERSLTTLLSLILAENQPIDFFDMEPIVWQDEMFDEEINSFIDLSIDESNHLKEFNIILKELKSASKESFIRIKLEDDFYLFMLDKNK